ncbi:MAG: PD-(D/E)XK nuclease family protein [Calditrichaeota bacterium]|nr:MAG: PD-(D/E)XK nuclease family protein [Calditrichota bacterium]
MPARFKIIARNRSLVKELATELASNNHNNFENQAIVVPNRRLLNYVQLELAQRLGACIPPKILTIESLAKVLPHTSKRPISTTTQRIILNAIITEKNIAFTQSGMEPDIIRFFSEISDAGHGVEIFDQITALLHENPFYDERHVEQLVSQTQAWKNLYSAYSSFLQDHNIIDRSRDIFERVAAYEQTGGSHFSQFADRYFVIGFADASAIQIRLLNILQNESPCEIWFHCDAKALLHSLAPRHDNSPYQPLASLVRQLNFKPGDDSAASDSPHVHVARRLFRISNKKTAAISGAQIHVHQAQSPFQEAKAAVATARNLISAGHIRLEEIIIAVPDERTYGDLIWALCDAGGIPVNYALGIPAIRTQTGQWLQLILDLFSKNAPIAIVLDLFNNKVISHWLATLRENIDKNEVTRQLKSIAQKNNITSDLQRFLQIAREKNYSDLSLILSTLHTLAQPFVDFSERKLAEWVEIIWDLTEKLRLHEFVHGNAGAYNIESRFLTIWINGLQQLSLSGELLQNKISSQKIIQLIFQNILSSEVRPAGQPFIGVQVLGMLELRGLSPKVLLVLGNTEGQFPGGPGRELFYSQPIRHKLGLTTSFKLEKLFDQQFYNFLCAAPEIHLFYSTQFNEDPLVRSRYLQRLVLFDKIQVQSIHLKTANSHLLHSDFLAENIESGSRTTLEGEIKRIHDQINQRGDSRGNFKGNRQKILSHYNYSTLKFLLHCPYRFLLAQLKTDDDILPEDEVSAADIGIWLHNVCQYFFEGIPKNLSAPQWPDLLRPWNEPVTTENREKAYLRLKRIGLALITQLGDQIQDLIFMEDIGWINFLNHEIIMGTFTAEKNQVEVEFDASLPEISAKVGQECNVTVRIDRVVETENSGFIIDYKKTLPKVGKIENGDEPQLPLYFHLINGRPEFAITSAWQASYRDFKSDKPQSFSETRLGAAWENICTRWQNQISDFLENNKNYEAQPSKEACQYCQYHGICRYEESTYLAENLEENRSNSIK